MTAIDELAISYSYARSKKKKGWFTRRKVVAYIFIAFYILGGIYVPFATFHWFGYNAPTTQKFETNGDVYFGSSKALAIPAIEVATYFFVNSSILAVGEPVKIVAEAVFTNISNPFIEKVKGLFLVVQGANLYPAKNLTNGIPASGDFFVNRTDSSVSNATASNRVYWSFPATYGIDLTLVFWNGSALDLGIGSTPNLLVQVQGRDALNTIKQNQYTINLTVAIFLLTFGTVFLVADDLFEEEQEPIIQVHPIAHTAPKTNTPVPTKNGQTPSK